MVFDDKGVVKIVWKNRVIFFLKVFMNMNSELNGEVYEFKSLKRKLDLMNGWDIRKE